jgi:hypothetical protein
VKVWQQSEKLLELPVEELHAIVGADELNVKEKNGLGVRTAMD